MKTRPEKTLKSVGDFLIGIGGVLCLISGLLFVLTTFSGAPNGMILFGGCTLGLLMVIAGYLKRISAVLIANAEVGAAQATSEVS